MSSLSPVPHLAQVLLSDIKNLPLWVKQVVFLELKQDLNEHFLYESLGILTAEDTIAFYTPKITAEGERMLLEVKSDTGQLLLDAKQYFTVLDSCIRHGWSLEHCCILLMEAIQSNWIHPPASSKALGTIEYMSNRIRLGEYLMKMGRISPDQLEQALRTQQYIKEAMQEHTGLANILINLGYITRQDTEGILFLKEESRKPLEQIGLLQKLATP